MEIHMGELYLEFKLKRLQKIQIKFKSNELRPDNRMLIIVGARWWVQEGLLHISENFHSRKWTFKILAFSKHIYFNIFSWTTSFTQTFSSLSFRSKNVTVEHGFGFKESKITTEFPSSSQFSLHAYQLQNLPWRWVTGRTLGQVSCEKYFLLQAHRFTSLAANELLLQANIGY